MLVFLSYRKSFVGTQKPVRISHGKRAVGVQAIESQLYMISGKVIFIYELGHTISYKIDFASSEDSDQPVHPCSLMRVFARYSVGSQE